MIKAYHGPQQVLTWIGDTPPSGAGHLGYQTAHVQALQQAPHRSALPPTLLGHLRLPIQDAPDVRADRVGAHPWAQGALGIAPNGKFAARGIDEMKAAPAGICSDRQSLESRRRSLRSR